MSKYLNIRYPYRPHSDDPSVLLLDANILIDFSKTDATVLAHLSRFLGPVAVLATTVREVHQLKPEDYARFGIPVEKLSSDEYAAAVDSARHLRSRKDDLCLSVCRSRAWVLATNDRILRRRCEHAGVFTIRGLELLLALVEKDALSRSGAEAVAWRLHDDSPGHYHEELLAWFLAELVTIAGFRD